jgi:hypothetical protein
LRPIGVPLTVSTKTMSFTTRIYATAAGCASDKSDSEEIDLFYLLKL